MWSRIAKLGDPPADITPQVLRDSFASLAADLGYNEPTIASLLAHKTHSITGKYVTGKYVHSADAVLLAAADAVATATLKLMEHLGDTPRILQISGESCRACGSATPSGGLGNGGATTRHMAIQRRGTAPDLPCDLGGGHGA